MARGTDYAARARALVGTRFRPQGRGPEGLDCLGLVLATYDIVPGAVRSDYRLRGDHRSEVLRGIDEFFLRVRAAQTGDLLVCAAVPDQLHFAVLGEGSFIHADAALKRVVESPGCPPWPAIGAFRRRRQAKKD